METCGNCGEMECSEKLRAITAHNSALALYKNVGFREYGRNPKGFRSRVSGWQELVLMRLELEQAGC